MSIRKAMITGMVGSVALLALADAGATDLKFSLGAAGEYDSNIYHRETKVRDDYFVVIGIPYIGLADSEGKFTYEGGYSFPYQHSIETNALRGFNHVGRLAADYHMSDQTQFSFSNNFRYEQSLSNNFDQTPGVANNQHDQQVLTNDATFGIDYLVSPRLRSQTEIEQEVYSTTQERPRGQPRPTP